MEEEISRFPSPTIVLPPPQFPARVFFSDYKPVSSFPSMTDILKKPSGPLVTTTPLVKTLLPLPQVVLPLKLPLTSSHSQCHRNFPLQAPSSFSPTKGTATNFVLPVFIFPPPREMAAQLLPLRVEEPRPTACPSFHRRPFFVAFPP